MGKNFSANNVDGKRKASDFYETPYSLTDQLLLKPLLNVGDEIRVVRALHNNPLVT